MAQLVEYIVKSHARDEIINLEVPLVLDLKKRDECCIYTVPHLIRKVNNDAYTPNIISIGPFHHGKGNLRNMEDLKRRYLIDACHRTKKTVEDLTRRVQEKETEILHCYVEISDGTVRDNFAKIILLDSIFILEYLWTKQNLPMSSGSKASNSTSTFYKCECRMLDSCLITCQEGSEEDSRENENPKADYGKKNNGLESYILLDLILLENQVPFFVLEELYDYAYRDLCRSDEDNSFAKLVGDSFLPLLEDTGLICSSDCKQILPGKREVRHITDFLRYFVVPSHEKRAIAKPIKVFPSATKLAESGVEFREVKNRPLLDIRFHKSGLLQKCPFLNFSWLLSCFPCFNCLENMQPVLELQPFTVVDTAECVIRNLMALEQFHYPEEAYICDYIVLLDNLINTAEDVDLLVEKKVIVNWLGSNEAVANLINSLAHPILNANCSFYYEVNEKIHSHYSSRWSKLMASCTSLYFRDFWRGTATVVGFVFLAFTFGSFLTPFVLDR